MTVACQSAWLQTCCISDVLHKLTKQERFQPCPGRIAHANTAPCSLQPPLSYTYQSLFKHKVNIIDELGEVWIVQYEGFVSAAQRHYRFTAGWTNLVKQKGIRVGELVTRHERCLQYAEVLTPCFVHLFLPNIPALSKSSWHDKCIGRHCPTLRNQEADTFDMMCRGCLQVSSSNVSNTPPEVMLHVLCIDLTAEPFSVNSL